MDHRRRLHKLRLGCYADHVTCRRGAQSVDPNEDAEPSSLMASSMLTS
jgi:hypothetical protein